MLRVVDGDFGAEKKHHMGDTLKDVLEREGIFDVQSGTFTLLITIGEDARIISNEDTVADIKFSLDRASLVTLQESF